MARTWRKNSAYFFGLEKHKQSKQKICKLKKNDLLIEDLKQVNEEIWLFYNLYKLNFQETECEFLFGLVKDKIKILNERENNILEEKLSKSKIDTAIKQMKNGKSPGIDGITIEFYKHFWNDIKDLLYNTFIECIDKRR